MDRFKEPYLRKLKSGLMLVCPFCYIGKRKFENVPTNFEGRQDVDIIWHSLQFHPDLKPALGQMAD